MSVIEEIISFPISSVIGRYCNLTNESGGRKKCRCPFHHEKTPSFFLDDRKGLWHCFGCGEGGNVFQFIQKIKGCDFKTSIDELCDILSIDKTKYQVIFEKDKHDKIQIFYKTMEVICDFYQKELQNDDDAKKYITMIRNVDEKTQKDFLFGLANNDINNLVTFCKNNQISKDNLMECGIIKRKAENLNDFYLFFRNRIIIPIHNHQGKIVAFGGRVYKQESSNFISAKYLNSGDSDFFKKGEILFNFYRARRNLKNNDADFLKNFIIVEGYMDVISLWQNGFYTAVAPLGTSITDKHLTTILQYCKSPIFIFDSDKAGIKASIRTCEMLFKMLDVGIIPRFCTLKGAKDVDEFLKKYSKQQLIEQMNSAKEMHDFLFEYKTSNLDFNNPNLISIAQKEINLLLEKIPNEIIKKNYILFFKDKFYSILSQNKYGKNNFIKNKNFLNKNITYSKQINNKSYNLKNSILNIENSLDYLEKKIIAILLLENKLITNKITEGVMLRMNIENQKIFENILEKEEKYKIEFIKKYIEKKNIENSSCFDEIKSLLNATITEWEIVKINNSNMPNEIKLEEKKKILENKKKILLRDCE